MAIKFHPHARERMRERGVNEDEIINTVEQGEEFTAKFGRTGFRRNFHYGWVWRGKQYQTKQVQVFTVNENDGFIVITVIVKYF
jgi:hypothetical protein